MVALAVIMVISFVPLTALAGSDVDLMQDGWTVYDANGNVVPQPRADLGGATIPAGGAAVFNNSFAYNSSYNMLGNKAKSSIVWSCFKTIKKIAEKQLRIGRCLPGTQGTVLLC
jgi:hypothetical protein